MSPSRTRSGRVLSQGLDSAAGPGQAGPSRALSTVRRRRLPAGSDETVGRQDPTAGQVGPSRALPRVRRRGVHAGADEAVGRQAPDIGEGDVDAVIEVPVLDVQEEEVNTEISPELLQHQVGITGEVDIEVNNVNETIYVSETIEIVNEVVDDSVIDLTSDNNDTNSPVRLGNDWTNNPSILARLPPPPARRVDTPPPWAPRSVDTPPPWTPRRAPVMVDLTNSPSMNIPVPDLDTTASPGAVTLQCPVCLDSIKSIKRKGSSMMSTMCGHIFCSKCLPASIRASGRCPTCRGRIGHQDYHKIFI